jgi:hypothetical protein
MSDGEGTIFLYRQRFKKLEMKVEVKGKAKVEAERGSRLKAQGSMLKAQG